MLSGTYYAQNYVSIVGGSLVSDMFFYTTLNVYQNNYLSIVYWFVGALFCIMCAFYTFLDILSWL